MSKDREIIEMDAASNAQSLAIIRKIGLRPMEKTYNDFEDVAKWANGDDSFKARALRILLGRLGRGATKMLLIAASERSNFPWQLVIAPRTDSYRPDGGAKDREWRKKCQVDQIGRAYYAERSNGLSDDEAVSAVQKILRLNLSAGTIRGRLRQFRRDAEKRGYVDPYAASNFFGNDLIKVAEPRWTVDQIRKPGRPKKNGT